MMLDAIRSLFGRGSGRESESNTAGGPDPLHLAACALLLDIAWADGEFSEPEREHLEEVLARHFALPPDDGRRLIELAEAERRQAVDHFAFTSVLSRGYDLGQKMVLAEVMWGLVLADGQIAEHEHYLARKIANLLDLEPGYLAQAKRSATERFGAGADRAAGGAA